MMYLSDLRSLGEGGLYLRSLGKKGFSPKILKDSSHLDNQLWNAMPLRAGLVKRRARAGLVGSSIFSPCLLHTFWLEKV